MYFNEEQKKVCLKYGAIYVESPFDLKVGVSRNIKEGIWPINGMRHPLEGDTTGWYLQTGDFSEDPDFFIPLHVEHLKEWRPEVLKYLGLAPGWRFLLGEGGYEDVWEDRTLLTNYEFSHQRELSSPLPLVISNKKRTPLLGASRIEEQDSSLNVEQKMVVDLLKAPLSQSHSKV